MIGLSSSAGIPVSCHRLDPCPNIRKVSHCMCGLKKADCLGELKGLCQGGPVCGPPLNEVSSERKRDTERKEGERKRGGADGSKTQPNWLPTGRGGEQGEKSSHIQAAHFLTNYPCKTSLSFCFQLGPCFLSLSLSLLSLFAVWDQELENCQHCRQHQWQKLHC